MDIKNVYTLQLQLRFQHTLGQLKKTEECPRWSSIYAVHPWAVYCVHLWINVQKKSLSPFVCAVIISTLPHSLTHSRSLERTYDTYGDRIIKHENEINNFMHESPLLCSSMLAARSFVSCARARAHTSPVSVSVLLTYVRLLERPSHFLCARTYIIT